MTELLGSPHPGHDLVWVADQLVAVAQYAGPLRLEVRSTAAGARELVCRSDIGDPTEAVLTARGPLYVFRPLLARMAVLGANETANDVSPYGGSFTLYRSGRSSRVRLDVTFENTTGRQSLDIRRTETADHRGPTRPDPVPSHLAPMA